MPEVQLILSFDNVDYVALDVPLVLCKTFAVYPLKWLQYVGFAIYGSHGHLSETEAGPELDYTADIEARAYYFLSQEAPRLADIDALDARTSDASSVSQRRKRFRDDVVARDVTCVISRSHVDDCQACHLLPHSKKNDYMLNVREHRIGRDDADSLDEIDDVRNGVLLHTSLHHHFGSGHIAFLKTPNTVLTVDDIPYNPPRRTNVARPTSRLTLHHLIPSHLGMVKGGAPHNVDARQPEDTSKWPPDVIIDLVYASAVLNAWGPRRFSKYARDNARIFYHADDEVLDSSSDGPLGDGAEAAECSRLEARNEKKAQTVHHASRPEERSMSKMMDGVLGLWMKNSMRARGQIRAREADIKKDEIKKWLQSTEAAMV